MATSRALRATTGRGVAPGRTQAGAPEARPYAGFRPYFF